VPPLRLIVDELASAMNVPPQLPVAPLGFATVSPAGSESVNPTPVSGWPESLFVTVNDSVLVPPLGIELGVNELAIDGGLAAEAAAGNIRASRSAGSSGRNDNPLCFNVGSLLIE
jgi:hypothetical protein